MHHDRQPATRLATLSGHSLPPLRTPPTTRSQNFRNTPHRISQDTANWNELFQEALELHEDTEDECYTKWQRLTTVNRDFVAAAMTYGKTIISEYFLPERDKSIK